MVGEFDQLVLQTEEILCKLLSIGGALGIGSTPAGGTKTRKEEDKKKKEKRECVSE